jgi:hypothetical protein
MFKSARQCAIIFPNKWLRARNVLVVAIFSVFLVPDSLSFSIHVARLHTKTTSRQIGRRCKVAPKPFAESDKAASSFQHIHQREIRHCTSVLDHSESVSIFDPTVGYGDMTGVKSFDDAWIEAFRQLAFTFEVFGSLLGLARLDQGDQFSCTNSTADSTISFLLTMPTPTPRRKDRIRCPFWRRRAVDLLEAVLSGARFLASRHKSLDVTPVKPTGNKRLVRCSSRFYYCAAADGWRGTAGTKHRCAGRGDSGRL